MAIALGTMCMQVGVGASDDILAALNAYLQYDLTWIELDMILAALHVRTEQRQQMSYIVFLNRGLQFTTVQ